MKVAIYCRVDTPKNEMSNEILIAQHERLERYAKVKGFEIVDSYLENGIGTDLLPPSVIVGKQTALCVGGSRGYLAQAE